MVSVWSIVIIVCMQLVNCESLFDSCGIEYSNNSYATKIVNLKHTINHLKSSSDFTTGSTSAVERYSILVKLLRKVSKAQEFLDNAMTYLSHQRTTAW